MGLKTGIVGAALAPCGMQSPARADSSLTPTAP